MRQPSSCLPWEPTGCSTYARDEPEVDSSNLKDLNNTTTYKQQCPIRPIARQWTSWTGCSTALGSETKSALEPASFETKSDGNASWLESECSLGISSVARATSVPRGVPTFTSSSSSQGHVSPGASLDHLKTLPTRPKPVQSHPQNKPGHCSVEENRLCHATQTQTDNVGRSTLALNRPVPSIEVNVARSRCHPRRRPCSSDAPAAMPKLRRDTDCTDAIVRLIVFFSTKLVHTIWSQASVTPKTSKDFNGAGVLPLQVFIQETLRRSKTSYSTLQVALFYLILLRPHVRPCQDTQQYTPNCRALQCGRRMFLTALILASKYLQDRNYSARAWSKISGLPVAEINENERHYLGLIKYNLHMSKDTFENWSRVVLTVCKASGQGPLGGRPDSPPSSPDGLSYSMDIDAPGSSAWWSHHLIRLTPDMVKSSKATEEYLAGLAVNAPFVDSSLSFDTPPSSPESLEEVLSDNSASVVSSTATPVQVAANVPASELYQSPAPVGVVPTRPLPPNLPTPQTTPRYDNAFTFSRKSSRSDLRCRASLQALVGVEKQGLNQANLETCPPPRPRLRGVGTSSAGHPLRDCTEPSVAAWMSSPESSFSDSASSTRSRSSSVSSVSSVWSTAGNGSRPNDNKAVCLSRTDQQSSSITAQSQSRANIGSYSFYHPVNNMHTIPEDVKTSKKNCAHHDRSTTRLSDMSCSQPCQSHSKPDDLNDIQIAQLLASLSSQSDGQVQQRVDPAVITNPNGTKTAQIEVESCKKHKRNRSSKEDFALQDEVRQFLWNEQIQVCVKDDKTSTLCVETTDKQAQYPLQQWAHPRKPVPNALHTKRIALQHTSVPEEPTKASKLAADFLRQGVTVM